MPCIVLDIFTSWSVGPSVPLIGADEILIVAAPDLANLRNTKNLFDLLEGLANDWAAALLPEPVRCPEAAGDRRDRSPRRSRAGRPFSIRSSRIFGRRPTVR